MGDSWKADLEALGIKKTGAVSEKSAPARNCWVAVIFLRFHNECFQQQSAGYHSVRIIENSLKQTDPIFILIRCIEYPGKQDRSPCRHISMKNDDNTDKKPWFVKSQVPGLWESKLK